MRAVSVFFTVFTKIVKLLFGVAATIGVFFATGYIVDYYAAKDAKVPSNPKFLPYAATVRQNGPDAAAKPGTLLADSYHTFFELLKEKKKDESPAETEGELPAVRAEKNHGELQKAPPQELKTAQAAAPAQGASQNGDAATGLTYTIQLGSFQGEEVARAFSENLAAKGYDPHVMKIEIPGKGTVYRVRIGKFKNIEDAQRKASEIEKKEKISVFITSK